jgi:hypothetical protein
VDLQGLLVSELEIAFISNDIFDLLPRFDVFLNVEADGVALKDGTILDFFETFLMLVKYDTSKKSKKYAKL